ncbi:MAG: dimethylargininase [Candidatus Eisenbacteria bacterium]
MRIAVTRQVSPEIGRCELTHIEREPIDADVAAVQHREYEERLSESGCTMLRLPALPGFPDAVFVEDTAVVLPELAVLARPGADSRRGEVESIAAALDSRRPLVRIEVPGTLDGGDVLVVGRSVYVGLSSRTNGEGARQLSAALDPLGYAVHGVAIEGCLHLKSAVGLVAPNTLLVNAGWVDVGRFVGMRFIEVAPEEPDAAGALLLGETVLYPERFGRTRDRLERAGIQVSVVCLSELAKAEGGVTCCSLVFDVESEADSLPAA